MSEIKYKQCRSCKQEFPATPEYFVRNKSKPLGLDCYCHPCNRTRSRKWESENIPYVRGRQREYSRDHIETIRKTKREWNARNPEIVRLNKRISEQRRKARKQNLPDDFRLEDWFYALNYFDNRCAICGRVSSDSYTLALDHWIPIANKRPDNPGNVPCNIIPLCNGRSGCNNVKKDRDAMIWLTEQYGTEKALALFKMVMDFFKTVRHE